jgi:arylsulfatase A
VRTQVKEGTPFYVQLSHYAVHSPVSALAATQAECAERPLGKRHQRVDYAAMTQDFDRSVGEVMQLIKELGIGKNTYVIFTSDNGAASRPGSQENKPLAGGKASLWEGGVRVPMIIVGPKVPADICIDHPVMGTDLFPTFCEIAGVTDSFPQGVEGVSLIPLLTSKKGLIQRTSNALVFHFPHYGRGPKQVPQSAIRAGDDKLIYDYESGTAQLFDLSKDLSETNDLSGSLPEKTAKMKRELVAYLKKINAQLPEKNLSYDPAAQPTRGTRGTRGKGGKRSRQKK